MILYLFANVLIFKSFIWAECLCRAFYIVIFQVGEELNFIIAGNKFRYFISPFP